MLPLLQWHINGTYVISSTICLASSLWVIYTAMNLINLSIHSTLNGETMREIAEADNLIEQRMREVRLVFLTSLAALIIAGLAMITQMTHWPFTIVGVFVFLFTAWHATESDKGTLILYQRYTGLEVKDRFGDRMCAPDTTNSFLRSAAPILCSISLSRSLAKARSSLLSLSYRDAPLSSASANSSCRMDAIKDLLIPFGYGTAQVQYLNVRAKANVAMSAFMDAGNMRMGSAKYTSKDDDYGDAALKAALAKSHIKKARLASRRRNPGIQATRTKWNLGTPPSSDAHRSAANGGVMNFMGMQLPPAAAEEALKISAETIQMVWRAGKVSKQYDEWHGGWLYKTASGVGPLEKLREAYKQLRRGEAGGRSSMPDIRELPPSAPRHARWFVLFHAKATLEIYTTKDDHRAGEKAKGGVKDLKAFAVIRMKAPDGHITLALLPKTATSPHLSSTHLPPPTPLPTGESSPGGSVGGEEGGGGGKSWYLRAEQSAETNDWFARLVAAGAHPIDTVHDAQLTGRTARGGAETPKRHPIFSSRKSIAAQV